MFSVYGRRLKGEFDVKKNMDNLVSQANKQSKFGQMMFGLLSLYLSLASYKAFDEALGEVFGPAPAVIIGTVLMAGYQIIKADNKNMNEGGYITNPYTQIIKNELGVYTVVETNQEQQRSSAFGILIVVGFIIWASEKTWANIL